MTATIKISGKAAVIGPDDVLVVHLTETPPADELAVMIAQLEGRLPKRWLIVGGNDVTIAKAEPG